MLCMALCISLALSSPVPDSEASLDLSPAESVHYAYGRQYGYGHQRHPYDLPHHGYGYAHKHGYHHKGYSHGHGKYFQIYFFDIAQWDLGRRKVILINQDICNLDSIWAYN